MNFKLKESTEEKSNLKLKESTEESVDSAYVELSRKRLRALKKKRDRIIKYSEADPDSLDKDQLAAVVRLPQIEATIKELDDLQALLVLLDQKALNLSKIAKNLSDDLMKRKEIETNLIIVFNTKESLKYIHILNSLLPNVSPSLQTPQKNLDLLQLIKKIVLGTESSTVPFCSLSQTEILLALVNKSDIEFLDGVTFKELVETCEAILNPPPAPKFMVVPEIEEEKVEEIVVQEEENVAEDVQLVNEEVTFPVEAAGEEYSNAGVDNSFLEQHDNTLIYQQHPTGENNFYNQVDGTFYQNNQGVPVDVNYYHTHQGVVDESYYQTSQQHHIIDENSFYHSNSGEENTFYQNNINSQYAQQQQQQGLFYPPSYQPITGDAIPPPAEVENIKKEDSFKVAQQPQIVIPKSKSISFFTPSEIQLDNIDISPKKQIDITKSLNNGIETAISPLPIIEQIIIDQQPHENFSSTQQQATTDQQEPNPISREVRDNNSTYKNHHHPTDQREPNPISRGVRDNNNTYNNHQHRPIQNKGSTYKQRNYQQQQKTNNEFVDVQYLQRQKEGGGGENQQRRFRGTYNERKQQEGVGQVDNDGERKYRNNNNNGGGGGMQQRFNDGEQRRPYLGHKVSQEFARGRGGGYGRGRGVRRTGFNKDVEKVEGKATEAA